MSLEAPQHWHVAPCFFKAIIRSFRHSKLTRKSSDLGSAFKIDDAYFFEDLTAFFCFLFFTLLAGRIFSHVISRHIFIHFIESPNIEQEHSRITNMPHLAKPSIHLTLTLNQASAPQPRKPRVNIFDGNVCRFCNFVRRSVSPANSAKNSSLYVAVRADGHKLPQKSF